MEETAVQDWETVAHDLAITAESLEIKLNQVVREAAKDVFLAYDALGWKKLTSMSGSNHGPALEDIRQQSERLSDMLAASSFVRRLIDLRTSYVWSSGVEVRPKPGAGRNKESGIRAFKKNNDRILFSPTANAELETRAATEGNVFALVNKRTKRIILVPLAQIAGQYTAPGDPAHITHFLRRWEDVSPDGRREKHEKWYALSDYNPRFLGTEAPTHIKLNGKNDLIPVDSESVMVHAKFNSQGGWHFGVPDLFCVQGWVRGYKNYLENGQRVSDSLAKVVFAVAARTEQAAAKGAASVTGARPGSAVNAGGVPGAVGLWGGADFSAVDKSGAQYDFLAGTALAEMAAAGLSLPVELALARAEASGDKTALDEGSVQVLGARQRVWDWFITELANACGLDVEIEFYTIKTVPVHRATQAYATASSTGVLHPDEVRQGLFVLLRDYGLVSSHDAPPEPGEWAEYIGKSNGEAPKGQDPEHPGTTPLGGPGDGDNTSGDNDLRTDADG